jgi:hypothetical protein
MRRRDALAAGVTGTLSWTFGTPVQGADATATRPEAPAEVKAELPGARLQGRGRLRFLGLRVYEARLWTAAALPAAEWATQALALELVYARALQGTQIAERSLVEMQRQGEIEAAKAARWLGAMKQVFPDVQSGERITGLLLPGLGARFYFNGQLKGDVRDAEFARLFFGIWLSPRTSEPSLRDALLGKGS